MLLDIITQMSIHEIVEQLNMRIISNNKNNFKICSRGFEVLCYFSRGSPAVSTLNKLDRDFQDFIHVVYFNIIVEFTLNKNDTCIY